MVEKKLNFNQPILSVRRYSQKGDQMDIENAFPVMPRLRPYRSELNSGPVRSPGAVPFQWEQAPGQPKEQIKQNRNPSGSDEAFLDELDSTESFLSSSSLNSLTGMDDRDADPSRRFSTDPQARELMMDRLEPQYAPKKQSEIVNQDKAAFWYRPTFAKSCSHYKDDRDQNENLIAVCCLLPRSCIKISSVCIAPAMNVRTRLAMFQARGVQSGSSSADSLSEIENEDMVKPVGLKENKVSLAKEIAQLESHNALKYPDIPLSEDKEGVCAHEGTCIEGFGSLKKSFKTLQELLADEDSRKEFDSRSRVEKELYLDAIGTETMQESKNKVAKNVEKQILRATTLGNSHENYAKFPVPPPLPRSPSDSWLFRTLPSMSAKKATTPTFVSRFSNKS